MSEKSDLFNRSVKTKKAKGGKDIGLINTKVGSTITAKENGTVTMNSGIYAQYKCDTGSGVVTEISVQSISNTVQKELTLCDLIVNRHKFNTQFFEFTNLVSNMGTVMGNLTVNTTMLVKAWEPTLQQYVLIRRPARFAMFGNLLDAYIVDDRLDTEAEYNDDILEWKRNLNDLTPPTQGDPGEQEPETEEEPKTEEGETGEAGEMYEI